MTYKLNDRHRAVQSFLGVVLVGENSQQGRGWCHAMKLTLFRDTKAFSKWHKKAHFNVDYCFLWRIAGSNR